MELQTGGLSGRREEDVRYAQHGGEVVSLAEVAGCCDHPEGDEGEREEGLLGGSKGGVAAGQDGDREESETGAEQRYEQLSDFGCV